MKIRKVPLRKCVACGENKAKKELIRIVKNNENHVSIDTSGKLNGRGAYICANLSCVELAESSKKLNKSLKIEVPKEIYEDLKNMIKD